MKKIQFTILIKANNIKLNFHFSIWAHKQHQFTKIIIYDIILFIFPRIYSI